MNNFINIYCVLFIFSLPWSRKRLNKFYHFSRFCSSSSLLNRSFLIWDLRYAVRHLPWLPFEQMFFSWTLHYIYVRSISNYIHKTGNTNLFIFFYLPSILIHTRFPPCYFLLALNKGKKIYQKKKPFSFLYWVIHQCMISIKSEKPEMCIWKNWIILMEGYFKNLYMLIYLFPLLLPCNYTYDKSKICILYWTLFNKDICDSKGKD